MTNVRSITGTAIFDDWSESNMGMLLGVNEEMKNIMDMLKDFLVIVWSKCKRMSERVFNGRQIWVNEHNYVRE